MSRSALTRERRWWQIHRFISNSEEVIDEKTSRNRRPGKRNIFCLTWPGRSTVHLNRSTRTPLDSERPKLSVGLCHEALSHSGVRWRGGWQPPPPPALRCVLVPRKRRCGRGLNLNIFRFEVDLSLGVQCRNISISALTCLKKHGSKKKSRA